MPIDQDIRDLRTDIGKLHERIESEIDKVKEHGARNRTATFEVLKEDIEKLEKTIYGNGKPGLQLDLERLGVRVTALETMDDKLTHLVNWTRRTDSNRPASSAQTHSLLVGWKETPADRKWKTALAALLLATSSALSGWLATRQWTPPQPPQRDWQRHTEQSAPRDPQ